MTRTTTFIVATLLLSVLASPAQGSFQGEWDASVTWANPTIGEAWYWSTGVRLGGDWTLTEGLTVTIRGSLGLDALTTEPRTELERCYLEWEGGNARLRLGRQSVSWGMGWFFRPTDLITPRSPLSPEEGRPGKDLLTLVWSTSALTNVELVAGQDLYGARAGWQMERTSLRVLALSEPGARKTVGFDVQGGLAGFYGEAAYEWTEDLAEGNPALVVGWRKTLGSDRVAYLEYLHDERGRFYPSQDYLAAGLEIPRDELTTYTVAALGNLADGGTMVTGLVSLLLTDNLDLKYGITYILGPADSEFLTLAGGGRAALSVQAKYYF